MVKFKEHGHKYYTLDGKELNSVSGLMHMFEAPVDWNMKAHKKAKNMKRYQGITMTPDEVKAMWENARIKGTQAGTIVHKQKEDELLAQKGEVRIKESESDGLFKYALDVAALENNTIYPELMIYDLDYGISGQSDVVEIKDDYIHILDHKTDKSIEFKGYSSMWEPAPRLQPPLQHLEDCNGNKYALKMSLYMYLVWKASKGRFKPGDIILNWCPIERDEEGLPVLYNGKPRILYERKIKLPYKKKEVIEMLEYYKKQQQLSQPINNVPHETSSDEVDEEDEETY